MAHVPTQNLEGRANPLAGGDDGIRGHGRTHGLARELAASMRDQLVVTLGTMSAWVTSRRKRSPARKAASSISFPPSAPVRLCSHASGLSASLTRDCSGSAVIAPDPSAVQLPGSAIPYTPWRSRTSAPTATALSKRALRTRPAPSAARGPGRTRTAKARSIGSIGSIRADNTPRKNATWRPDRVWYSGARAREISGRACASGQDPSAWRVANALRHSSARPWGNPAEGPISPGIAPATCCRTYADAA